MKSAEIRQRFLDFFARNGHEIVPSSPLVPGNDPTLLFTNAGMVQFKEVFLGLEKRPYTRAASCQRCVRAGGKHNDLENVGYTARHHTFFEMLGNFSFGDYFKEEAIRLAWVFLTEQMGLAPERLWITVYDEDDEAADIWLKKIGVAPERFSRISGDDNFWSMGDVGPCGPCTEVFYDHGPEVPGGPPGSPDADADRYVEIWNLVFMQYNRDHEGTLHPLPKPSVDTGMGLERLATVLQGVHSNYDIDLFRSLIRAAAEVIGVEDLADKSLRVIADHIRSCAFLVVDGVVPSNEGRGYVLRRIIRRALRHGHHLGATEPFFYRLVAPLVQEMGQAYPELAGAQSQVERVLRQEEQRFAETLDQGMKILNEEIGGLSGKTLPGEAVFRLYDTYGFPADLTADIAREHGIELDMVGFERAMAAQRERARAASHFSLGERESVELEGRTDFTGYTRLQDEGEVTAILVGNTPVTQLEAGQEAVVVLDRTPFYAESGGQAGDHGRLRAGDAVFEVSDTRKLSNELYGHVGRLRLGSLALGDRVRTEVEGNARQATACNHSATHLLHAALKKVLGGHVQQKGSLVTADRLRFDFSHFEPVTAEQLAEIEQMVNERIRANDPVSTDVMGIDEAKAAGAVALFGEKYGTEVRVVGMGEFSLELCGGTHVARTGDIGLLRIVAESGIASGVRRIEAITGARALEKVAAESALLDRLGQLLKAGRDEIEDKVRQVVERGRALEKQAETLQARLAGSASKGLAEQARQVDGIQVLAARLEGADNKALREAVDKLKDRLGSGVVVLGAEKDGKVLLVAGVTKDLCERVQAGKLINEVARQVGGKGGGRPDMAQAGGTDPAALADALESVYTYVAAQAG
jgi:alanyl-tRNA synthetase